MIVNEDYLASLLLKRFSAPGGMGVQRFVHVRHPQLLNSFVAPGKNRILDYLVFDRVAQNKWGEGSVLLESVRPVHGFEIKVSTSDLVVELKDLSKSEAWSKHCSHFWLVVSDKSVVEGLPAGVVIPDFWGVLCLTSKGDKLRVLKQPVVNKNPVPWESHTVGNLLMKALKTPQPQQ